jgi:arylsulfatase A-like enzyme
MLDAGSQRAGAVALWASPTLSGTRRTKRPNVVLYIIDGGSADHMSAYGYHRRTTPNLERLAAEGAIFERAYSNSAWTRPSTASFLTSLHHSVLGGLRHRLNPVPEEALTLAEHLRMAGYQTAQFTSNSNAGRISRLERGADYFREAGVENWSTSSVDLHRNFWRWRREYPAEPFYVHFQTTDVHNDHTPVEPFAGMYVDPQRRQRFERWLEQVNATPEAPGFRIREALEHLGIDQREFWSAARDLHDESMAQKDHQIGELVKRLRAEDEWENTLLVVASDHGIAAGAWDYRLLLRDPQPAHVYHDDLAVPILRSGVSRIPLLIVWPSRIAPGQRFRHPVSMIDVLPTILQLADLPLPEVAMGQSLAPLLLGAEGWQPRPVIFDEVEHDADGGVRGRIEVVDGRWGASLEIGWSAERPAHQRRPAPLLLFDLSEDPDCLSSLHEERPDLVARYRALLEERWAAHQELAGRFTRSEQAPLSSDQLETLRALGYIQ